MPMCRYTMAIDFKMMKNKTSFITITVCVLVVALLAVAFFALPDKELSQKENRTLAQLPTLSYDNLLSGEYTADLAEYISDQFPARDAFVSIKAYSELLLGKGENNGVIYAKNNILVARDEITKNNFQDNIQAIRDFSESVNIPVCLGILPRSVDVFSEYLPSAYPHNNDLELWQDFYTQAKEIGVNAPNLYDVLCEGNNYYRTDHHYNIYGAYETYSLLGKQLDYVPYDKEFFKTETVSQNFCGTSMRASGFYLAPKDEIILMRYDGDSGYNIAADGKDISLYDMSKCDTADQYAVFLGGNHARVDIKNGEDRQKLLVIRDSFADSLAPFLALHYDLVMIDLRYYADNVQKIVVQEDIDKVLVLQSISEFATTKNITSLRWPYNE